MPYNLSNASPDLSEGYKSIQSQIGAFNAYTEATTAQKEVSSTQGNSNAQGTNEFAQQLNSVAEGQKAFQRNIPTSYDQLLTLIKSSSNANSQTQGGIETTKELRKILLDAVFKMEPYVAKVISEEAFKVLGCSQEQTYPAVSQTVLNSLPSLSTLPANESIYVNLEEIDFFGTLKVKPQSLVGRIYYETTGFTQLSPYINYSGPKKFPMNYELRNRTQFQNQTFKYEYALPYYGKSNTNLWDFEYVKQNDIGATGDYIRVFLLQRPNKDGQFPTPQQSSTLKYSGNTIVDSLSDYYGSIKTFDSRVFAANLINLLTGSLSADLTSTQVEDQSKFFLILNRIFGLCESGPKEIDVAGTSKISEYDNVGDEFFNFNEVDNNNINQFVNDALNGTVTFVECNNLNVPVNNQAILEELTQLNDDLPVNEQVDLLEGILDSIVDNWEETFPGVGLSAAWLQNILKKLPIALLASIFTPKVLLPIFTFKSVIENQVLGFANELIQSGNTILVSGNSAISSANTINNIINSQIASGVDFARKFKKFVFGVVSRVAEYFLEILFEQLKRNLLRIVKIILKDIYRTTKDKRVLIIQSLLEAGEFIVQTVVNYRECKSLVGAIQKILKLINKQIPGNTGINKALIGFAGALPGFSPERAAINAAEELQGFGVRTGPTPDGQPNKMIFYQIATQKGLSKEDAMNSVVDIGIDIITGLPIGKSR
jgi:hypothetical protein